MKIFTLFLFSLASFSLTPGQAAAPRNDQASIEQILAQERFLAALSTDSRLTPTNFVGRLMVHLPVSLAQTPDAVNGMAITAMSLAGMAVDPNLLQDAWVSSDPGHQTWKAMWPKPPLFHYGMVLLPALIHKLNVGQTLVFESQGQTASLLKDDKGHLLVQRGGVSEALSASDLRDLLRAKINADGMSLFLDNSGNLVLQATGPRALALANIKTGK